MDSSVSPTHGEQEMSVWNGHYECTCDHPLFVFNQFGDLEHVRFVPAMFTAPTDGTRCSSPSWRDLMGLTHLFSGGRGLRESGSLRVPRSRADKVCDPVTGEPCPAREDCISADAAGRTTSERDAAISREFHLSGRKLDE